MAVIIAAPPLPPPSSIGPPWGGGGATPISPGPAQGPGEPPRGPTPIGGGGGGGGSGPGPIPTAPKTPAERLKELQDQLSGSSSSNTSTVTTRSPRLPTAIEFLSDFNNAWAAAVGHLNAAGAGITNEMLDWANSNLKNDILQKYTAAMAAIAEKGNSPYYQGPASIVSTTKNSGTDTTTQKSTLDGTEVTGTQTRDVTAVNQEYESVAIPIVNPFDFIKQNLNAGQIKLEYEGARTGAGRRYLMGGQVSGKIATGGPV